MSPSKLLPLPVTSWASKFDLLKSVTPFDARWMLALIALPTAWKTLSLDFSPLGEACGRQPLFPFRPNFLYELFNQNLCSIFDLVSPTNLQIMIAVLLVFLVIFPRRLILLPCIVMLWTLDTSAYLFRGTLYTLDTPLALLFIIFFIPARLRDAFSGNMTPCSASRYAILAPLFFIGTYYFLAGAAKLDFAWNWPAVVRVGNYYPISYFWHTQEMPPLIDAVAKGTSDLYLTQPWLDTISAFIVLVEQFVWIAAPFSALVRLNAGLFAAAYHIVVALTTGIFFITWIFIALSVTLPFTRIWRSIRGTRAIEDNYEIEPGAPRTGDSNRFLLAAVCIVPIFLAALPSKGIPFPPFHNYYQFGWRYQTPDELGNVYRVGFEDPSTGRIRAFPLGHGAYLDFRQTAMMDFYAKLALTLPATAVLDNAIGKALRTLLSGTTSSTANGWLLGEFRAPAHLMSVPASIDMRKIERFFLMIGTPVKGKEGRPLRLIFQICGEILRGGADGKDAFTRYEKCKPGD